MLRRNALAAAVILIGAAVSLALNLPGHLSYDSVVQLAEGRAGTYSGEHPLVMSWLLGLGDALAPGPSLFVVLDTGLVAGALVGFALIGRRVSVLTAPLAIALAALPQLLIWPAIVWKDVLFAASAVAGFACLAQGAAGWAWPVRRYGFLAGAAALLTLAALARQNGPVVLPLAAIAVGWIAARSAAPGRPGRPWLYGLGFLSVTFLVGAGAAIGLDTRLEGRSPLAGEREALQSYDIVGAMAMDPSWRANILRANAPSLETLMATEGVAAYTPVRADPLEAVLGRADPGVDAAGLIDAQWQDLIVHRPLLYLRARAKAFEWVFLTPDPTACVLIYTGVDGPAEEMASAGLVYYKSGLDDDLADYALAFAPTPLASHAAYGALGLGLLVVLLRRRRPADIAAAAMVASAMAFTLTFWVLSIACDYRYLYYLDLAVIAAALYAVASWGSPGLSPAPAPRTSDSPGPPARVPD